MGGAATYRYVTASVGLLLTAESTGAACGVPGLSDPSTWDSITDAMGVERCYKLFSGPFGDREPFGTWADCAATCQANEATVGGVRDEAQAAVVSSLLRAEAMTRHGDDQTNLVWIGFNALENPRDSFRWATNETLDPASAVAELVSNEEVVLPWSGDLLWVGEEGSCAATQLCAAAWADSYGQMLRASLHQCDGPVAPARCLCEFSTVSSAAGTPFDTSDGVTPAVCGDGNEDMCSSWGSDCRVLATREEQVFTCRNGYRSEIVSTRADCGKDGRCTEYECCDPRTTLSQTIAAANEVIYEQYDGRFVDEDACYWEHNWHYWVIGYASFYAVLGLGFLVGFLVACACCAPKQPFSTRIQSCSDDVGICCLTCWCPCITWGQIAEFTLNMPSYVGCLIYCCCSNLTCCAGMLGRAELRKKLAIGAVSTAAAGDCCVDCCVHCCAHSCALCQEMREIDLVRGGGRPIPAPMTMGMIPAHGTVVQAHVVDAVQPVQPSAVALPVGAVPVPLYGYSGTLQNLPGDTGTSFNPAAKTEHQP